MFPNILPRTASSSLVFQPVLYANDPGASGIPFRSHGRVHTFFQTGGEPILAALLHEPAVTRHSPTLTVSLQEALVAHQSASLRGLGTPQKRGGSAGGAPLSALPFDEEQDSRNIPAFKTQVIIEKNVRNSD